MPESSSVEPDPAPRRRSLPRRVLRLALRVVVTCALAVGLYFGAAEIGMRVSVNSGADPLAGTVDVYLVSNGVHVDIWVPAQHAARDWTTWFPHFVGRDSYHLLRTCNVWTNEAVKAMDKRAGLWTPFERNVRHHLPRNRGGAEDQ